MTFPHRHVPPAARGSRYPTPVAACVRGRGARCLFLAQAGDASRPPWRPVSGEHPPPRGALRTVDDRHALAHVRNRSKSRRGGHEARWLSLTHSGCRQPIYFAPQEFYYSITSSAVAEERFRHVDTEQPGGLKIDRQLEFCRLQHRQISGLCYFLLPQSR
jgi:hypothetical protein